MVESYLNHSYQMYGEDEHLLRNQVCFKGFSETFINKMFTMQTKRVLLV